MDATNRARWQVIATIAVTAVRSEQLHAPTAKHRGPLIKLKVNPEPETPWLTRYRSLQPAIEIVVGIDPSTSWPKST